jgi:hypothetical protein
MRLIILLLGVLVPNKWFRSLQILLGRSSKIASAVGFSKKSIFSHLIGLKIFAVLKARP